MGLLEKIRKTALENPRSRPVELAKKLIGNLGKMTLIKLIAIEIRNFQRNIVREIEIEAFRNRFSENSGTALQIENFSNPNQKLSELLRSRFALGDGNYVFWGKATIQEHLAAVVMLQKMRDGIEENIQRHMAAIEMIRKAGINCLDDIKELTLQAI